MTKQFRLKKEALPYFKEKYATRIADFDTWDKLQVDMNALEEVEPCYLTYGHNQNNKTVTHLGGWSQEEGARFHFTIIFPSIKHREYDQFNSGRQLRGLMDEIQRVANNYMNQFNSEQSHD
jgi:hypothetical protein